MNDDTDEMRVCHNCVRETYLSKTMADNGVIALCDYCEDDDEPTITVLGRVDEFDQAKACGEADD